MSSLSGKQALSLVALVIGVAVFLGTLAQLTDFNGLPSTESGEIGIAKIDCMKESDYAACADRVDREFGVGPYEPWYEEQPIIAALIAGAVTFFVIAGGGRLFLS